MICISILRCSSHALSPSHNTTTTKPKYKRIVGDKSINGLWFDRRDLIFNWFWIVTKTRRRHNVHLCLTRFQTKLRWELDQLRVGQFYCHFWPIFSLLFLLFVARALTIFTTETLVGWPGLKLNEKFAFGRDIFRFFLFSPTYAHGTLTEKPQTLTTRACLNTLIESQWGESRNVWAVF